MKKNIVWTIAGSDSGGFAGIQADLKTFQQLGTHGCSVITAVTSQNRNKIAGIHYLPHEHVQLQINTLFNDLPPVAIKIGMLGNLSPHLLDKLQEAKIVLDPLISSTSGNLLHENNLQSHLANLRRFYSHINVITPNLPEAEKLVGFSIESLDDIENAAQHLLNDQVTSVLIKGGHFPNKEWAYDYWTNGQESFWLSTERITKTHFHGTGCTLSSAITAALGLGYEIKDAIVIGKLMVTAAIQQSEMYGLTYSGWPNRMAALPYLSDNPLLGRPQPFQNCGGKLGLYPIVDSADWISKLLPLGISTIQLRIKNLSGIALENEIQKAIRIAKQYHVRLFINDYWEYAIKYHAYGVHLGQEDLQTADIPALREANIRLGISTHSYYEVAHAHTYRPSYIAFGPIYHTNSKIMPFLPQGISKLKYFTELLDYPVVAIGGINAQNISDVFKTGVSGIAMISAITGEKNFTESTLQLLKRMSDLTI